MIGISAPARPIVRLTVLRLFRIAPRMTRVVLAGAAVGQFGPASFTDTYVRIMFAAPGVFHPDRDSLRRIRAELPRAAWPRSRTYTVRALNPAAGELTIDIFDHGRPGLTPPWLAALRPGDPVLVQSPFGHYRPGVAADWHLLAGDTVALPAVAATLEAMTPGTRALVVVEVTGPADELPLPTAADADIRWLHRCRGETLTEAVRSLTFEPGVVQAFVHGEGGAIGDLRRHLVRERGVAKELLSISG